MHNPSCVAPGAAFETSASEKLTCILEDQPVIARPAEQRGVAGFAIEKVVPVSSISVSATVRKNAETVRNGRFVGRLTVVVLRTSVRPMFCLGIPIANIFVEHRTPVFPCSDRVDFAITVQHT